MKKFLSIICFLLIAGVAGCSGGRDSSSVDTVRMGFFPNVTHAQALLGVATGAFDEAFQGVKVEYRTFNAGPDEIEALLAGQIDLAYIGPVPAINGYARSGKIRIISGAANGGAALVSRPDVGVRSVKDLVGRTVAVPQYGNTQDLVLRHLLQAEGLKAGDEGGKVNVVQVQNPNLMTLFTRREIDAALVPEPWCSRVEQLGVARMVSGYEQVLGSYPTTVVVVREEFARQRPDLVGKFLEAHRALTRRLNAHPAESAHLIIEQIKSITGEVLSEEVVRSGLGRINFTDEVKPEHLRFFGDALYSCGYARKPVDTSNILLGVNY